MSDTFSADSKAGAGAFTALGAGATLAAVTGLQAGARYRVSIYAGMTGTIDTADIQNLRLQSGGVTILDHIPSVALGVPIVLDGITLASGATDLTLIAIGAFAAASIVSGAIVATRIG